MPKLSLLAGALVLAVFCLIAIATASSGGSKRPETALAQSATATAAAAIATTAPAPSSGPQIPYPIPPTPTLEPGRGLQETTLVDLQTGKTTPLWQGDERVGGVAFSPDGHRLVFTRLKPVAQDTYQFQLYQVDLQAAVARIDPLTTGFMPPSTYPYSPFSARGYLAFAIPQPDGTYRAAVMLPDGSVHQLAEKGLFTTWSPDGRWLTYQAGYTGENQPMAQYLVDTQTWQERKFAETLPCDCDGGPRPVWSPDSRHFVYRSLIERSSTGSRTSVYDTETLAPAPAPEVVDWIDGRRYLASEVVSNTPPFKVDYFIYDIATGDRVALDRAGVLSPDRSLLAAPGTAGPSTDIVRLDGSLAAPGLWGTRPAWSPDGAYVATQTPQSDCGAAALIYRAGGQYLYCARLGDTGLRSEPAFSPDSRLFAYVRTRWLVNPPRSSATPVSNDLYVIDLSTGHETLVARDMRGFVGCIYWSPDSRFIVAGACGGV